MNIYKRISFLAVLFYFLSIGFVFCEPIDSLINRSASDFARFIQTNEQREGDKKYVFNFDPIAREGNSPVFSQYTNKNDTKLFSESNKDYAALIEQVTDFNKNSGNDSFSLYIFHGRYYREGEKAIVKNSKDVLSGKEISKEKNKLDLLAEVYDVDKSGTMMRTLLSDKVLEKLAELGLKKRVVIVFAIETEMIGIDALENISNADKKSAKVSGFVFWQSWQLSDSQASFLKSLESQKVEKSPSNLQEGLQAAVEAVIGQSSPNTACTFDISEKYVYAPNGFLFKAPKDAKWVGSIRDAAFVEKIIVGNKTYTTKLSQLPQSNPFYQGIIPFYGYFYSSPQGKEESLSIEYLNDDKSNKSTEAYFVYTHDEGKTYNLYKTQEAYDLGGSKKGEVYKDNLPFFILVSKRINSTEIVQRCNSTVYAYNADQLTPQQNALLGKYRGFTKKSRTYIYEDGQLLTFYPNSKNFAWTLSKTQFDAYKKYLKEDKEDKEKSKEDIYILEKTTNGYKITVNFGENVKVKAGYDQDGKTKEKSEEAFEQVMNEYLKDKNNLGEFREEENSDVFTDGKTIKLKRTNLWDLIGNGVKASREFIEKAEITPKYWDKNSGEEYNNNWINTPPLASGLGNGVIEELKEIPQLVAFGADIAVNKSSRDTLVKSLKELTWQKLQEGVVKMATDQVDTYAGGGDKAWHQGGKDAVMVASMLIPGGILKNGTKEVKDQLKSQVNDVAKVVKKAGFLSKIRSKLGESFLEAVENSPALTRAFNELGDKIDSFLDELAQSPVLRQRTLANPDYVRAFKEYEPNRIYQIKTQQPINSGKVNPLQTLNGTDIYFDNNGFPDFTRHVQNVNGQKAAFKINMQGTYEGGDFAEADRLAGISQSYRQEHGLTWHHHQDGQTMMLVPKEINSGIRHTGGKAVVEHNELNPNNILYFPSPIIP